jgi:hypothetical protein
MMTSEDASKAFAKLVARTWADEDFKAKLIADPAAVLAAEGIELPTGMKVNVIENSDSEFTMVLPPKPSDLEDVDLENVAGGGSCQTCGYCLCVCFTR